MDFSLYDNLQGPVIAFGSDLKLSYFNFVCSSYFHLPPRKLKASPRLEELIRTEEEDLVKLAKEAMESDSVVFTKEILARVGENEQDSAIILKFIPMGDSLVAHIQDFSIERTLHDKYKAQILELKEGHDQIVRSDKLTAMGELVSGISHEIATPLTIVGDRLDLMQAALEAQKEELARETLNELKGEFNRIGKIISGMQSYARNQEEEIEICSLAQVAKESVEFIKGVNVLGNIELVIEAESPCLAIANPLKIQQVFINLLKNSVDSLKSSSQDSKVVKIAVEEADSEQVHVVRVFDNGPGVPEEAREKIFDMFYTSKDLGEGTGLGLNISQKIIQDHNGSIRLNETSVGCEFVIELPVVEVGSFTATNRYLRGESDVEDEKVLVVGDDAQFLNQALNLLKNQNKVVIISSRIERIEFLADFFSIDKAIKLKKVDLSFLEAPCLDLSDCDPEEALSRIAGED